jgi:lambda repressor-like predicted transcriptional regulator
MTSEQRVRRATAQLLAAEKRRDQAVIAWHQTGESLRVIAVAAGLSHMTVQRIVERRSP